MMNLVDQPGQVAVALKPEQHFPFQWLMSSGELTVQTRHDLEAMWNAETVETLVA